MLSSCRVSGLAVPVVNFWSYFVVFLRLVQVREDHLAVRVNVEQVTSIEVASLNAEIALNLLMIG